MREKAAAIKGENMRNDWPQAEQSLVGLPLGLSPGCHTASRLSQLDLKGVTARTRRKSKSLEALLPLQKVNE